jgi:kumamolisin
MTSSPSPDTVAAIEATYRKLGELLGALEPRAGAAAAQPCLKYPAPAVRKLRCRNYIKYPSPQGVRPHALAPYHVADLCQAYDFPTDLPGGGVIGILELGGGYTQPDLDQFAQLNNIPQQIIPVDVSVDGGENTPHQDADDEVLLDIQVAAATYFYCTGQLPVIKMFFAPNADASFQDVIRAAVANGCDVLSISWGKDEGAWDPGVAGQVESVAQAASEAQESGLVIFASSGDNSSGDAAPGANVDMPSSCPHIIGCGGTKKTRFSEVVWGDGTPNGQGTGGGYSVLFPPQEWQLGAPPSPGKPGRMVPDVAADADPNTGYLVVVNGHEVQIGGTSAVAPFYAGLFAACGKKLGFVTPTLWSHPGAFTDITQGSNGSFSAQPGPDPCTGLGVPKGKVLAALLSGLAHAKR